MMTYMDGTGQTERPFLIIIIKPRVRRDIKESSKIMLFGDLDQKGVELI